MNDKLKYIIIGVYAQAVQKIPEYDTVKAIADIRQLVHKHKRQCENNCNCVGVVRGKVYYNGNIDDYARRTYGANVQSAYTDKESEETVFDQEIERIQNKIIALATSHSMVATFQHDPRGWTVKLHTKSGINISTALYV